MGQVARTSQRVITRLGHFVRIEAIRTERHQTRHTPLQAYMDEESIAEHVRPWQQMLMFFARTQVEHEWTSPQYRFTPRQRKTWRVLWQVATTEGADQRHPISPDPMDEQMTEEEEEEEEKGQRDTQSEEEDKFKSTKIQMACLDFCIELLDQRVQVEDYECALVDALAVLGRGEYGWRDAESYPTGGGGMDVHSIQGRSGYEIQHIQIKSDNSAGKGLHCGVKVNELRWGWNGRPFHLGLENLRKPTNQSRADWAYIPFGFRRRSGYEIQHIQIKSDNSAGKGLHCGVKVNELRQRSGAKRCKINKVN
ncbi:predicted protein [Histoplasma mississippiense (nom. inval.)]|uniref:predicted protein n=1 Tax=Ajellomyces capsulatus (strain NAm1 / WU24) TaxID=2059318 RepID=UPI000157C3E0|nr:predicted protein [Histoplasma mississippiense (nom. inval.)]EDN07518.1 predicted protein [Histoplasma mississippiense (nom. inval.)]